ncbi:hypothetical protein Sste5344_007550, partial [Sporothrix stenoceras]
MFTSVGHPVQVWSGLLSGPSSPSSPSCPVLEVGVDLDAAFGKCDLALSTEENSRLRKSLIWTIRNNTEMRLRRQLQQNLEDVYRLQQELYLATLNLMMQQHR